MPLTLTIPAGEELEVRGQDDPEPYSYTIEGPITLTVRVGDEGLSDEDLYYARSLDDWLCGDCWAVHVDDVPDAWLTPA